MKFSIDDTGAGYKITAYEDSTISINGRQFDYPVLVSNQQLINDIKSPDSQLLDTIDIQKIIDQQAQILIIGCGKNMHFLPAELMIQFQQSGIGVEIMTTSAACRTYNVLLSEGRDVIALIF